MILYNNILEKWSGTTIWKIVDPARQFEEKRLWYNYFYRIHTHEEICKAKQTNAMHWAEKKGSGTTTFKKREKSLMKQWASQ